MSSTAETRVSVEIAGSEISFETGKMAKQASGSVVVRQGDTVVLGTATAGNLRDVDFLPLTVDVEERMYAAGKIPGSFFKREGRSGEKGTLTARMIDRPIRPLFPKGWRRETQLVSIPLSIDHVHPYDILAMNGASAALMLSDIPFPMPVGAVRIGKVDGNFVVNPNEEDLLDNSDLDLVVAGTEDAILMVEAGRQRDPRGGDPRRARHRPRARSRSCAPPSTSCARRPARRRPSSRSRRSTRACSPRSASRTAPRWTRPPQVVDKLDRQDATKKVEAGGAGRPLRPGGRRGARVPPRRRADGLRQAREDDRAPAHRRAQEASGRPRGDRDPPDHGRGRPAAAHARLRRCSPAARRRS